MFKFKSPIFITKELNEGLILIGSGWKNKMHGISLKEKIQGHQGKLTSNVYFYDSGLYIFCKKALTASKRAIPIWSYDLENELPKEISLDSHPTGKLRFLLTTLSNAFVFEIAKDWKTKITHIATLPTKIGQMSVHGSFLRDSFHSLWAIFTDDNNEVHFFNYKPMQIVVDESPEPFSLEKPTIILGDDKKPFLKKRTKDKSNEKTSQYPLSMNGVDTTKFTEEDFIWEHMGSVELETKEPVRFLESCSMNDNFTGAIRDLITPKVDFKYFNGYFATITERFMTIFAYDGKEESWITFQLRNFQTIRNISERIFTEEKEHCLHAGKFICKGIQFDGKNLFALFQESERQKKKKINFEDDDDNDSNKQTKPLILTVLQKIPLGRLEMDSEKYTLCEYFFDDKKIAKWTLFKPRHCGGIFKNMKERRFIICNDIGVSIYKINDISSELRIVPVESKNFKFGEVSCCDGWYNIDAGGLIQQDYSVGTMSGAVYVESETDLALTTFFIIILAVIILGYYLHKYIR